MIAKIPAILIPIPWAYGDEQMKNALLAKDFGIDKVLEQERLTPDLLYNEIDFMVKNWDYFSSKARRKVSPDIDASKKLVTIVKQYI